jgi:hypothetical protein
VRGNVPLAAASLKLFAGARGLERSFEIEILPSAAASHLGDEGLVAAIAERRPWLVGFTCYLWNVERSLWVAARVKERLPEARILLGGPEVTADNGWLLEHPSLDFACAGEGEQTFAELLESHLEGSPRAEGIPGLMARGSLLRLEQPRRTLSSLSSPYLAGILDAREDDQLLLETARGCVFRCKFCHYPKAHDSVVYLSPEEILASLAQARDRGIREVFILDPTMNQRGDFDEFLDLLARGNPGGRLELHGELRAEGITPARAGRMCEANFKEVEIGLQSVEPAAQALMGRRNDLKAFERGVRALRAEGIRVKVDLIVGLPGDTVDSVRRGMRYLADGGLFDDIQVFQLSVLPGTAFREEAASLGLEYQPRPPYHVVKTAALSLEDIRLLLREAEDVFETEFDPLPPPALGLPEVGPGPGGAGARAGAACWKVDLDAGPWNSPRALLPHALSIHFRAADPYRRLGAAKAALREVLDRNPFTVLEIVLETESEFPLDVYRELTAACRRTEGIYLDRFHELGPPRRPGSHRFVTVLPGAGRARIEPDWVEDALRYSDIVWDAGALSSSRAHDTPVTGRALEPEGRAGEWRWVIRDEGHPALRGGSTRF